MLILNGDGSITGNPNITLTESVSIAGTVTYEDVTNIDSVGIITARAGVRVTGGSLGVQVASPTALLSLPAGESNTPRFAIESAVDDNDFTISQYEDGNGTYTLLGQNVKLNSGGNNTILDSAHRCAAVQIDARNHGAVSLLTGDGSSISEVVKVDKDGYVGISTSGQISAASYGLPNLLVGGLDPVVQICGTGAVAQTSSAGLAFAVAGGSAGNYTKAGIFALRGASYNDIDLLFAFRSSNDAVGVTPSDEKIRIDSDGRLLVNTSVTRVIEDGVGNGPQGKIQVEATDSDAIMSVISAGTADANRCGTINLGRHRNSTVGGTPTLVSDKDALGCIAFSGGDGTDMRCVGAKIHAEVDGAPGGNDMPGAICFSTTPDGVSGPYQRERMRIRSNGDVILGPYDRPQSYTNSAWNIPYEIKVAPYGWDKGSELASISMGNHSGSTGNDDGQIVFKTAKNVHSDTTGLTERLRINSNGVITTPTNPYSQWRITCNTSTHVRTLTEYQDRGSNVSSELAGNGSSHGNVGRFTAPVTGAYLFTITATGRPGNTSELLVLYGSWTGSTTNSYPPNQEIIDTRGTVPAGNVQHEDGTSTVFTLYLAASDYLSLDWYRTNTSYLGTTIYTVSATLLG